MNLNEFVKLLCEYEGGDVQVNIAQMKQVIHNFGDILNGMDATDQFALLAKICKAAWKSEK